MTAQQQDPEISAIVQKLLDPLGAAQSEFRMPYVVHNGVLGVREAEGRIRTVVPPGSLRGEVCRYFHDGLAIQGCSAPSRQSPDISIGLK